MSTGLGKKLRSGSHVSVLMLFVKILLTILVLIIRVLKDRLEVDARSKRNDLLDSKFKRAEVITHLSHGAPFVYRCSIKERYCNNSSSGRCDMRGGRRWPGRTSLSYLRVGGIVQLRFICTSCKGLLEAIAFCHIPHPLMYGLFGPRDLSQSKSTKERPPCRLACRLRQTGT
jgi:hypothetical protein